MRSKSFFKTCECKHCRFKFGGSEVTDVYGKRLTDSLKGEEWCVSLSAVSTIFSVADEVRQEGVVLNCQQDEI